MRDYSEKYLLIRDQFPNKAGELLRLITAQKRLIKKIGSKQSKDVQELMLASAEAHDVAIDLLDWMKQILQGIAEDAIALNEGSKVRNSLNFQSAIIDEYLNRYDKDVLEVIERAKLRGYEPKV